MNKKFLYKRRFFYFLVLLGMSIGTVLLFSACSAGPGEYDVAEAFISYTRTTATSKDVIFDEGSTTAGHINYFFDGVVEDSYGYTFSGTVRDDFTEVVGEDVETGSHSFSGALSLSGGAVSFLVLDYTVSGGQRSGTVTGESIVIDVGALEAAGPAE